MEQTPRAIMRHATSTPNSSFGICNEDLSTDISIIKPQSITAITVNDASTSNNLIKTESQNNTQKTSKHRVRIISPEESVSAMINLKHEDSFDTANSDISGSETNCDGSIHKDSVGRSSGPASASGECDATRAEYYHNKLVATMQILQNKEETVRIQAESLAVAEARIASLTARGVELKKEIDNKTRELRALQKTIDSSKVERTDVSTSPNVQELEQQKIMVATLQNNLRIIEDLYRECFYESAKQEGLIEMLRTSYLDVRLMEKEKSDHIGRLQNVINKQKWSFEQSQDIAAEVDNLKMEISNFLNSSNNDSGMWERSSESISAGIGDDLHDIMDQLLRLRELLTSDCNCGLEEENKRLKQKNETLEAQIGEFRNRVTDLETTLLDKESLDTELQHEIDRKEEELNKIRQNLVALEETTSCHSATCETLSRKLQETEELLNSKSMQLVQMQQRCQEREKSIRELRSELDNAAQTYQENCKMKSEIAELTSQISAWQSQQCERDSRVRALEREMARLTNHCLHIDQCYKVKAQNVAELQAHLEEAHERGAVLCAEARHAVCAVRQWARRMRAKHKEQEAQIKEKESLLYAYQRQLQEKRIDAPRTSASEKDACIRCIPRTSERSDSYTSCLGARQKQSITASPSERDVCRKCNLRSESYTIMKDREQCESNCRKVSNKERREMSVCTSESEMASCSSVPVPPKRMYRKKQKCGEKRCECRSSSYSRDACVQLPIRRDAATLHSPQTPHPNNYDVGHVHIAEISRDLSSPTEELLNRVERLGEALADGQRRWTRGRHARTT